MRNPEAKTNPVVVQRSADGFAVVSTRDQSTIKNFPATDAAGAQARAQALATKARLTKYAGEV